MKREKSWGHKASLPPAAITGEREIQEPSAELVTRKQETLQKKRRERDKGQKVKDFCSLSPFVCTRNVQAFWQGVQPLRMSPIWAILIALVLSFG